jgi:hypothetical protein
VKLKYKPIILSSNAAQSTIIEKIEGELEKAGYAVKGHTKNRVEFKYSTWRFGSNFNTFSKVDGGIFDITAEGNRIVLSYYLDPSWDIFLISFAALFTVTIDVHISFIIAFFVVMFLFRMRSVRNAAREMAEDLFNTESPLL